MPLSADQLKQLKADVAKLQGDSKGYQYRADIAVLATHVSALVADPAPAPTPPPTPAPSLTLSGLPDSTTTATSASIGYSLSGIATVFCRRDGYMPVLAPNPFVLGSTAPLAAGSHTVDYFLDTGNGIDLSKPAASYSWTILAAPVVVPMPYIAPYAWEGIGPDGAKFAGSYDDAVTVLGPDGTVRIGPVADPSGKPCRLHRIKQGEMLVWNGHRSELTFSSQAVARAIDNWCAVAVKFDTWPKTGDSGDQQIFHQLHQRQDALDTEQAPTLAFQISGIDNCILIQSVTCPSDPSTDALTPRTAHYRSQEIALHQWYRIITHVRIGPLPEDAGRLRVWINDMQVVDYVGPIGFINAQPDWWKLGIYKWRENWDTVDTRSMLSAGPYMSQGPDCLAAAQADLAAFV